MGALGETKGFQVSREKNGAQEPWRLPTGRGRKARVERIEPLLCTRSVICTVPMCDPQWGTRNQNSKMEPNLTNGTC